GDPLDPVGHYLWMLDVVGGRVNHAWDQDAVAKKGRVFKEAIFVGVPWIRHGEHDRAGVDLRDLRPDVVQRYVTIVRPLIVAPTDMQPDLLARDALQRAVDGG